MSITLSHYCPTASDLLYSAAEATSIVANAPAFPPGAEYVGLTADPTLPPLLHSKLAMDWESWWLFEGLAVSLLSDAPMPLVQLAVAVELAREWRIDDGPLPTHLAQSFDRARSTTAPAFELSISRATDRITDALAAVPEGWRDAAAHAVGVGSHVHPDETVYRRFLAAHAFANWSAYQGEGLRTWFRSVETAAALLAHTNDPGQSDLVLRHLADPAALVRRWNDAEREPAFGVRATPRP